MAMPFASKLNLSNMCWCLFTKLVLFLKNSTFVWDLAFCVCRQSSKRLRMRLLVALVNMSGFLLPLHPLHGWTRRDHCWCWCPSICWYLSFPVFDHGENSWMLGFPFACWAWSGWRCICSCWSSFARCVPTLPGSQDLVEVGPGLGGP